MSANKGVSSPRIQLVFVFETPAFGTGQTRAMLIGLDVTTARLSHSASPLNRGTIRRCVSDKYTIMAA